MSHLHLRHLSPELIRLLLASLASLLIVGTIYATDSVDWGRNTGQTMPRTPVSAATSAPATIEPSPSVLDESLVAQAPPAVPVGNPVLQASIPEPQRYTVKPGDSLTAMGLYFGARNEDLIALNALPADGLIFIGQVLTIPQSPVATPGR